MTIQEALKAAQEIFPGDNSVSVSIDQVARTGNEELTTTRWIFSDGIARRCVSSSRSWEHVLALAGADNNELWPEDKAETESLSAQ